MASCLLAKLMLTWSCMVRAASARKLCFGVFEFKVAVLILLTLWIFQVL